MRTHLFFGLGGGEKTEKSRMDGEGMTATSKWGPAVCLGISPENPKNLDFSENSNFIFSLFFGKIGRKPPRSLKLDAGNRPESISAQSERI